MKKTLIALTVAALASTSASALTVYKQDKSTIDVGGAVQLALVKETDVKAKMVKKDANINVKAKYGFADDAYALGFYEYDFLSSSAKKAYVGVGAAGHQVTFGLQNTFADGAGQANFKNLFGVRDGFIPGDSDNTVAYRFTGVEGLEVGADYILKSDKLDEDGKVVGENPAWFDLGAKYTIADLTVALAFAKVDDAKAIDAGLAYTLKDLGLTLGLDTGFSKVGDVKAYYVNPGVKMAFGESAVYSNYGFSKVEDAKTHKFNLGVEYKLAKNSKVYTEVGYTKAGDAKTKQIGVGMKVEW